MAVANGIPADQIVDIYFRYDKRFLPLHRAVIEFKSRTSASDYLIRNAKHTLGDKRMRMNFMTKNMSPERLRPTEIGVSAGRCAMVQGFPRSFTLEQVYHFFRGYQLSSTTNQGIVQIHYEPPFVNHRYVVHLVSAREAERLVRDTHNRRFDGTTEGTLHMLKAQMLY
ncbi:hypothetical protein IWQ60_003279 [Tieghemiomyces parasiticus]|uniref:Uncharacterized protein n=1 Tax=Tieghemiomyces parasiticus TaxID=78921 RepID=A0A9W8AI40_9FUNG|nr:hypothetical protein IWQ60_003279 [Tieghemiomyces parasiticus]